MKAVVTVGISASGKSTWASTTALAAQVPTWVLSRDNFRRTILHERFGRNLVPGELWVTWRWRDEDEVTARYEARLRQIAAAGEDVICADTNLDPKRRTQLVRLLEQLGYTVEIRDFPIKLEDAWKRDAGRPDGVGHTVIYKQYQQWLEYQNRRRYTANIEVPDAVIVDVDGTLADMTGVRGPFDWAKVHLDRCHEPIADLVEGLRYMSHRVIVLSGRDGCCEPATRQWLDDNSIIFDELYMRAPGDRRPDAEIKEELFWTHVAPRFNVRLVIDDRPVMCRRWMELGLRVLNVGNPYIEF